jgi:glutamate 5-kinase
MSGRAEYLSSVKSAVVKLGTQLLSDASGNIDAPFIATIAKQVAALRGRGIRVTLVSSGAIGCGIKELKLPKRPTDLAVLQAVAAVGQRRLMDIWAAAFAPHQTHIAQLLLTREDIDDRSRFLNLRNTIAAAHELGAIPIINENDTVSTAEIERISFGDNDILAALVAHALRADLLALLTVVDGVQDAERKPIRLVTSLEEARKHLRPEKSALGKGGMDSKFNAGRMMTDAGEAMIVADGRMPDVLLRIMDAEEIGTLFAPAARKRSSRDRWISSLRTTGKLTVDDGARKALQQNNRSLLPAGIVDVSGEFARGDAVAIVTTDGTLVARGLSNYSHVDMLLIKGKKTSEVRQALPDRAYDEAVHKDNLVLERL